MTNKSKTFRRAAAAAAAICLAFAFAFAEETGADKLGFGTSVTVSAADTISVGTATLDYTTDDDNNVTITKVNAGSETSIVIPETIPNVGTVKTIELCAFKNCTTLESITLPDSITSIEYEAFRNCTALKSINIPDKVVEINSYVFRNCSSLTGITLPNDIVSIGDEAFEDCTSLKSIIIPSKVTSIGDCAFDGCDALETIIFPYDLLSTISSYGISFWGIDSNITAQLTYTQDSSTGDVAVTFANSGAQTSVNIPANISGGTVKTVFIPKTLSSCTVTAPAGAAKITYEKDAAANTVTITKVEAGDQTSIEIPPAIDGGTVTEIGANAFDGCSTLTSIDIPDSVTRIYNGAFNNCTSLTSITIPYSVKQSGTNIFEGCSSLQIAFVPMSAINVPSDTAKIVYTKDTSGVTINQSSTGTQTSIEIPPTIDGGTVTIIEEKAFMDCSSLTNITLPDNITSIGKSAFRGCTSLTSITLPDSLTSIEGYTFSGCTNLKSIEIPSNVTGIGNSAFYNCNALASIEIPSSVTSIEQMAFYGCKALTGITLPDSVTSIGNGTFSMCISLKSISIPKKVTEIPSQTFTNCSSLTSITLHDDITNIGNNAFSGCSSLESISIPKGINTISINAFKDCTSLTSIALPDGVTSIKSLAFSGCTALKEIDMSDNVTEIGSSAFSGCTTLKEINMSGSVTDIGSSAFSGCSSLTSFTIPFNVSKIGTKIFEGCDALETIFVHKNISVTNIGIPSGTAKIFYTKMEANSVTITTVSEGTKTSIEIPETIDNGKVTVIGDNAFNLCSFESIVLPKYVTSIGNNAFNNCGELKTINIPDGVESIGEGAFNCCGKLAALELPQSITSIGSNAFYECGALTVINIPDNVTKIEDGTFYGCSSLTSITIPSKVKSIGTAAFRECSGLETIDIPDNVTSIGGTAFAFCNNLTSIVIPYSVQSIGTDAFATPSLQIAFIPQSISGTSILSTSAKTAKIVYTKDSNGVTINQSETGGQTSIVIPPAINGGTVKTIDNNAFNNTSGKCSSLESITLPDSITSIGEYAFSGTKLNSIEIPENVANIGSHAFSGCIKLETVKLPKDLAAIKERTFENCSALTSINIPNNLTSIEDCAFSSCTSITEIKVPQSVQIIGSGAFQNCFALERINIPQGVQSIELCTFSGCKALKEIDIPDSVGSIKESAFAGCTALTSVTIPKNVTSIEAEAFANCTALKYAFLPNPNNTSYGADFIPAGTAKIYYTKDQTNIVTINSIEAGSQTEIVIPGTICMEEVRIIGDDAFKDNAALTKIELPDSITSIGEHAFLGCSALTDIKIPDKVTTIGESAFLGCKSLESITIPDGVERIEKWLFCDCEKLKTVNLPENAISICENAFENCKNLVSINLPANLDTIYAYAFYKCTSLASVDFPSKLRFIEEYAFSGCESLASVKMPESVASIGEGAFDGCISLSDVTLSTKLNILNRSVFRSTAIKSIVIPENVTQIGDGAFSMCSVLESVELPPNVKYVGYEAFYQCTALRNVFYNTGTDISDSNIPDTSARTKYEIRDGYAYILEVVPDSSNSLVVIPDYICEYEVMSTVEKYRQYVSETGHIHKGGTATCTDPALCNICGTGYNSPDLTNHDADTSTWENDDTEHWNLCLRTGCGEHLNIAAHTFDNGAVTTEPTETADGVKTYTCKVCGYEKTETVPMLGHSPAAEWTYDSENHWKECTTEGCNEKLDTAAHDFDDGVITVKPTDTTDGVRTYTCKVCGYEKTETVSMLGHTSAAEWTYDSENHWKECTNEGCEEKLDTAAHDFDDGVVTAEPTTTSVGVRTYTCTVCGYEKTETIPKLEHTAAAEWKHDSELHWRDCATEGCGEKFDVAAHTFDNGVVTTEPTKTSVGVMTYTCAVCGYEKTETVPMLEHTAAAEWKHDSELHWRDCATEGCGEKFDVAAHTFDDGVVTTEPTKTSVGVMTYTCAVCGYEKTETVPMLEHTAAAEWKHDSELHWRDCATEGCGEKFDVAAHTFDDGVVTTEPTETAMGVLTYTCTVCGYEKTESIDKLPSKPIKVIYPITISGDVTVDKPSAAAGETVTVSSPFGYDIIITAPNGKVIAKISEKGSFTMPASGVRITAVRNEVFAHMSNAWKHSYVYSYDSDMNRIKVNSDIRKGIITIDLGADHAGRSFTLYSGRKSTSKKIISGVLDKNGRYTFESDEGKNYTLVVE